MTPTEAAERDSLSSILRAIEAEHAKINSMVEALSILANHSGNMAPLFFTLMNAIQPTRGWKASPIG